MKVDSNRNLLSWVAWSTILKPLLFGYEGVQMPHSSSSFDRRAVFKFKGANWQREVEKVKDFPIFFLSRFNGAGTAM